MYATSKFVIVIGLLLWVATIKAQPLQDQSVLYKSKIQTYRKVERMGLGLIVVGGISTAMGSYYINGERFGRRHDVVPPPPSNYPQPIDYKKDNDFNTGMLCLTTGIPPFIGGMVLTAIGVTKVHYYKKKQSGLSLGMSPRGAGLSLTYKF